KHRLHHILRQPRIPHLPHRRRINRVHMPPHHLPKRLRRPLPGVLLQQPAVVLFGNAHANSAFTSYTDARHEDGQKSYHSSPRRVGVLSYRVSPARKNAQKFALTPTQAPPYDAASSIRLPQNEGQKEGSPHAS